MVQVHNSEHYQNVLYVLKVDTALKLVFQSQMDYAILVISVVKEVLLQLLKQQEESYLIKVVEDTYKQVQESALLVVIVNKDLNIQLDAHQELLVQLKVKMRHQIVLHAQTVIIVLVLLIQVHQVNAQQDTIATIIQQHQLKM